MTVNLNNFTLKNNHFFQLSADSNLSNPYLLKSLSAVRRVIIPFLAILIMVMLTSTAVFAQKQVTPPPASLDSSIEDRLIALATNGPTMDRSIIQDRINDAQLKKAKNSYLNLLTVSTYYNFQTQPTNNQNTVYAPGLNLGITIPFGIFFTKASDVKIAKETKQLNLATREQLKREIKSNILSRYKQYQTYLQLIVIESRIIDDQQATVSQIEKKFSEGKATVEEYNATSKSLNNELATRLRLQLQMDQMKLEIEAMIGVPLESVLKH